jgi:hypothetical protein
MKAVQFFTAMDLEHQDQDLERHGLIHMDLMSKETYWRLIDTTTESSY